MINSLHKTSAYHIMRSGGFRVQPFWYQYWDRCIRDEEDYRRTMMYIVYNPVKHGYSKTPEAYRYSSYYHRDEDDDRGFRFDLHEYLQQDLKRFEEIDDF